MVEYVEPEKDDKKKSKKKNKSLLSTRNIILIFIGVFILSSIISGISYSVTDKIAIIPVKGAITVEGSSSLYDSSSSARAIIGALDAANSDPTIKAVILDINSPGGSAVASEEIGNAILEVRNNKPVYAVVSESGTSGALWVSAAANKTFVSKMSVIGSIGVTSVTLGFENLIKDYNITYRKQTAGEYKDLGSPFREPTEKEEEIIQGLLDKIHANFIEHIASSRNLTLEEVETIATGEVFLGDEAIELGLVDEIGNIGIALDEVQNITNAQNPVIVDFGPEPTLADVLGISSLFEFDTKTKVLLQ